MNGIDRLPLAVGHMTGLGAIGSCFHSLQAAACGSGT